MYISTHPWRLYSPIFNLNLHVYLVSLASKHTTSLFFYFVSDPGPLINRSPGGVVRYTPTCKWSLRNAPSGRDWAAYHKLKKTYVRYRLSPWPYSFPVEKRSYSQLYTSLLKIAVKCIYTLHEFKSNQIFH